MVTIAVTKQRPGRVACYSTRNTISRRAGGEALSQAEEPEREGPEPGDRLSRMSQASLRITETLDLDTVLRGVVDGACTVTGARHGGITVLDDAGSLQDFITSGLTPEEHRLFVELPGGPEFFVYLSGLPEPLRLADFSGYTQGYGAA